MKLLLFDENKEMCDAWTKVFENENDVSVVNKGVGDLELGYNYLVIEGNNCGVMDSGTALSTRNILGIELQDSIQKAINQNLGGSLDVGNSLTSLCRDEEGNSFDIVYLSTHIYPNEFFKQGIVAALCGVFFKYFIEDTTVACSSVGLGMEDVNVDALAVIYKNIYDFCLKIRSLDLTIV